MSEENFTVKQLGLVKRARAIVLDEKQGFHSKTWANRILKEHEEDVKAGRSV